MVIPLSVIIRNFCKIVTQIVLPRKYPSQSFFRWNLYFFYAFSKGILLDRVFRFRYNDNRFALQGQDMLKNVQKYKRRAEINMESCSVDYIFSAEWAYFVVDDIFD